MEIRTERETHNQAEERLKKYQQLYEEARKKSAETEKEGDLNE